MSENAQKKTNAERIAFLNEVTEKAVVAQEKELVTDYDKALLEYKNKNNPYKVRFKGRIFEIPRSMPFPFAMFYMRYCLIKKDGKTIFTIPDDKFLEFIERMFGARFTSILRDANDIDTQFVVQVLIPDVLKKWGYDIKGNPEKYEKNV